MLRPIYREGAVEFAYELRWSLALFSRPVLPDVQDWQAELTLDVERDGVRILEIHRADDCVTQFLLSTRPSIAPPKIVRSVKGRLQHLLRHRMPDCFRRNFSLTSVGEAQDQSVLNYIARQIEHHHGNAELPIRALPELQLQFPGVDIHREQFSTHGRYVYALHLVLEFTGREPLISEAEFASVRDMVRRASAKHRHRLARCAILANHLHVALSPHFTWAPERLALSYMNNIAFARGMNAVLRPSAFLGSIGPYNLTAVRRRLE